MMLWIDILTALVLFFFLLMVLGLVHPKIVFKKSRVSVMGQFGVSFILLLIILSALVHFLGIL